MLTREDGHKLPQVRGAAQGRRRVGAAQAGAAYTGAAYMQLFNGGRLKGMVMEKNGIEIENLNLGKI